MTSKRPLQNSLPGKHVLVVEDSYMIADDLRATLEEWGSEVVGPAATPEDALDLLEARSIDLAILDIDLRGEKVFDLAHVLQARGVAFVFASGYDRSIVPADLAQTPFLNKPLDNDRLLEVLNPSEETAQSSRLHPGSGA